MTENIKFERDYIITSGSSFDYSPDPVGSIIYTPEPSSPMDSLTIKISDVIGFDLFTKLRNDSEILSDNESFINYFHGLVLVADDTYESSVVGFNADKEDVKLIMYTSRENTAEEIGYEFKLENPSKQFNNIIHDFTSTQLNTLVKQRDGLSSTKTSGLSFLQGGIGLVIRVEFPSLKEILLLDRGIIVEAQLVLSPLQNSYNEFYLPSGLIMYESDKINRATKLVLDNQDSIVTSKLNVDELYHEETTYLFDVTKYLNDELADSYVDPEKGLLIMLHPVALQTKFDRLVLDAQNQNTKLKIYYLTY